ncbi:acyl-CoA hydrolase [Pseudonocardiaceae bacterium YIM PH 21723]|nr:acyl-CoA hydrolase [Pseudonocardiaceae bacterium YIM PH 21723]
MTREIGFTVAHRRYVAHTQAHYGGSLVDGAFILAVFGEVAAEMCIRTDGDCGLFAGYDQVEFRAPVFAGDILEAQATLVRIGSRSRGLAFEARVLCRATPQFGPTRAMALLEPVVVTRAAGTIVLPKRG